MKYNINYNKHSYEEQEEIHKQYVDYYFKHSGIDDENMPWYLKIPLEKMNAFDEGILDIFRKNGIVTLYDLTHYSTKKNNDYASPYNLWCHRGFGEKKLTKIDETLKKIGGLTIDDLSKKGLVKKRIAAGHAYFSTRTDLIEMYGLQPKLPPILQPLLEKEKQLQEFVETIADTIVDQRDTIVPETFIDPELLAALTAKGITVNFYAKIEKLDNNG